MPISVRPRGLHVRVGDRDVTGEAQELRWSSADPGGFESASFGLANAAAPRKGTPVLIVDGLQTMFRGHTVEIPESYRAGRNAVANVTVQSEGAGAALRDPRYACIYIERDFSAWQVAGTQRRRNLAGDYANQDHQVLTDSIEPSLLTRATDPWDATSKPACEAFYDAGPSAYIGAIYYAWSKGGAINAADTNWQWLVRLAPNDTLIPTNSSGDLRAVGPGTGTLNASTARRYATVGLFYTTGPVNNQGNNYDLYWTTLVILGDHGLPLKSTSPHALGIGDIVRHATQQSSGIAAGVIEDPPLLVPQLVYREPVSSEKVISDMAGLTGYHWGVWDPGGLLDDTPRLDFRAPPPDATAFVSRSDCEQLDIATSLANLYDTALVTHTDPAHGLGVVTVTIDNPILADAGITGKVLDVNAGNSTRTIAEQLGRHALLLSLANSAGGAGSATLPATVRVPGGGAKPAHHLRPGLDRLRVLDLPDSGQILNTGRSRKDTFRLQRIEAQASPAGVISTRAELDTGQPLLDVLMARLALSTAGQTGVGG